MAKGKSKPGASIKKKPAVRKTAGGSQNTKLKSPATAFTTKTNKNKFFKGSPKA